MSRGRKILIVGLVLVVGFGLAWPFRKTASEVPLASQSLSSSAPSLIDLGKPANVRQAPVQTVGEPVVVRSPEAHVVAKMARMSGSKSAAKGTPPTASFDLANHPAIAGRLGAGKGVASEKQAAREISPVTPQVPPRNQTVAQSDRPVPRPRDPSAVRPAYRTDDRDPVFGALPQDEVRHVVQNSDTLEKLAERYLGDAGRALEIFDLNREVLDNPHLLPMGAELRLPADAGVLVE